MKSKSRVHEFLALNFGTFIMAIGVYFFKFPNKFCTGGVSGIVVVLSSLFPNYSMGSLNTILNAVLLVLGLLVLGRSFAGKTVYCTVTFTLFVSLLEKFYPMSAPLTDQPVLELFYAVFFPAVGSAFLFYSDASAGGTDIIAMIVKKYSSLNIGYALMLSDALVVIVAGMVFGPQTGLFSLLGLLSKTFVINGVISTLTVSKNSITIIDKTKAEAVCEYITKELKRGATIIPCEGYYTHKDRLAIISVLRRSQVANLRDFVKQVDTHAFVIVTDTNEAYGKGFNQF